VIYLDTSALVSFVVPDLHSRRLRERLRELPAPVASSTFGMAEFGAVIAIRHRSGLMTEAAARAALDLFDGWMAEPGALHEVEAEDHWLAAAMVRRFDLGLRAPDALHLAVCRRIGLPLLTFDNGQAAAARGLGIACDPAGA
jgi:predicted nucleic acid-binding protein